MGDVFVRTGQGIATVMIDGDDVARLASPCMGDHDGTLIGATRAGLLQALVFGAVPEAVGERAENAVIMAKRNLWITARQWRCLLSD